MRPKIYNFDQLVNENKQALLADERKIDQIEMRLEQKQAELVSNKRRSLKLTYSR